MLASIAELVELLSIPKLSTIFDAIELCDLGANISQALLRELERMGINMAQCHGQSYDGASNMSGSVRGASAIIKAAYPKALYVHCRSHCLNLVLMKACTSISEIGESATVKIIFAL